MNFAIRLAQPEVDYAGIADIVNSYEPEAVTVATVRAWFEYPSEGRITHRTVAVDERGRIVGYGAAVHESWWETGRYYLWACVLPEERGKGIGTALYADTCRFIENQAASKLISEVRDNDPLSLQFAQKFGFRVDRHQFASILDLETFDETRFAQVIPTLESEGIRFFSLAEAGNTLEAHKKLYKVNQETGQDIPGIEGDFLSFEEFENRVFKAHHFSAEGQIIAADGDDWIGLTAAIIRPATRGSYNQMTGVLRNYRGRHIALALKLQAIRYCKGMGAVTMSTDNDSENVPMLAVNRKLGYQPQPGVYWLKRVL